MSVPDRMKQITDLAKEIVKLGEHKTVNSINTSLIKWRTGVPPSSDGWKMCLITTKMGYIDFCGWQATKWSNISKENVIAWCPLSEIEPYKE